METGWLHNTRINSYEAVLIPTRSKIGHNTKKTTEYNCKVYWKEWEQGSHEQRPDQNQTLKYTKKAGTHKKTSSKVARRTSMFFSLCNTMTRCHNWGKHVFFLVFRIRNFFAFPDPVSYNFFMNSSSCLLYLPKKAKTGIFLHQLYKISEKAKEKTYGKKISKKFTKLLFTSNYVKQKIRQVWDSGISKNAQPTGTNQQFWLSNPSSGSGIICFCRQCC